MKSGLFLSYHFSQAVWSGLDWIFPPVCGGCNRPGARWCNQCQSQLREIKNLFCEVCGLPLNSGGICLDCQQSRPPYDFCRSWTIYEGPIRHALHSLKYRRNISLGGTLAQHLASFISDIPWEIDVVIPVPLGKLRLRERGYNQVSLVARPLAAITGWDYEPAALTRVNETQSQVGLSREERKLNVDGAFHAVSNQITGKNILLMDDVTTTGATLASSASALLNAGAKKVYGLTIARVLPQHGLLMV